MEFLPQDFAVMQQVIEKASKRGIFEPAEFSIVGPVYEKIVKKIDAIKEQLQAERAKANAPLSPVKEEADEDFETADDLLEKN